MRSKTAPPIAVLALAAWLAAAPSGAQDVTAQQQQELDAAAPVLELFYEGVPYELAAALDETAVRGLIAVLDDPTRTHEHANALVALGMNGHPDAFDAIADYAQRGTSGELDRDGFRALRAVPFAMGHLARTDRRALRWLMRELDVAEAPAHTFRHMDAARVRRVRRRALMTGLALSGRAQAERALERLARSNEPHERRYAGEALAEHHRMTALGPAAALRADAVERK